jgi:hypothetical protein
VYSREERGSDVLVIGGRCGSWCDYVGFVLAGTGIGGTRPHRTGHSGRVADAGNGPGIRHTHDGAPRCGGIPGAEGSFRDVPGGAGRVCSPQGRSNTTLPGLDCGFERRRCNRAGPGWHNSELEPPARREFTDIPPRKLSDNRFRLCANPVTGRNPSKFVSESGVGKTLRASKQNGFVKTGQASR